MREIQGHHGTRRRTRRSLRLGVLGALIVAGATTVAPPPVAAAAETEVTAIASARADWTTSAGNSTDAQLAADGRFVAFTSTAFVLAPGVESTFRHVYLRDLMTDETVLVSHDQDGAENKSAARAVAITKTGSHVAFVTTSKLEPADTNAAWDVYVWTRATDTVELVSKGTSGAIGNGDSGSINDVPAASMSADGRYVAFSSKATNLTNSTDSNGKADIFRRDRANAVTGVISGTGALQGDGDSVDPDISSNGRYIAYATLATNLGGTDTNGGLDVWVRDTQAISPAKVSLGLDADPNGASRRPKVSDDGNLIAFESDATDLVANDTNNLRDVFLRNRSGSTTTRVSVFDGTGAQIAGQSEAPDMNASGSQIAFETNAPAAAGDTNAADDIYVRSGSSTTRISLTSAGAQRVDGSMKPSISSSGDVAWESGGQFAATDTDALFDIFVHQSLFIGPFDDVEGFVTTQFTRFRGAAPTSPTITAQAKLIRAGASPTHFIVGLADEAAFSAKRAPLIRLYWAYFKRRPDYNGLAYWLRKYEGGARLVDISQQFSKSNEFKTKYGNTTPEQFVTLVYQNVLERNPDSAGTQYWANKIRAGMPRGQVMTSFSESSEGKRIIGPRSDSILIALGMYDKIPSQSLFNAMVADRQAGWPREIIPAYILGAPEYAATLN